MSSTAVEEASVSAPNAAPPVKRRRKQIELTLELDLNDHAKNVFCVKGGSPPNSAPPHIVATFFVVASTAFHRLAVDIFRALRASSDASLLTLSCASLNRSITTHAELLTKQEGAAEDEKLVADADGVLGAAGGAAPGGASGPPSPWKGTAAIGMGSSRLDIAGLMARWCHGDANDSDDDGYDGTDGFIDDSEAGMGRVSFLPCRSQLAPITDGTLVRLFLSTLRHHHTHGAS